tara:strand:+ start:250 stop:429 length:180 start_codon:yes stop_codon:yes gene_type:complete
LIEEERHDSGERRTCPKPPTEIDPGRRRIERPDRNRVASSEKSVFVVAPIETEPEGRQI